MCESGADKDSYAYQNFGIEPEDTLLKSMDVAVVTAKLLVSDLTGQVIDVKLKSI